MSDRQLRFALLLFLVVAGHASAAVLTTEFGDRSVIVHGVTPGGSVAVFGLTREPLQTHPATPATVVRAEILKDTDGDGTVQLTLSVPVPRRGMWAVADLSSGASAAFPTPGYEPQLIALKKRALGLLYDAAGAVQTNVYTQLLPLCRRGGPTVVSMHVE